MMGKVAKCLSLSLGNCSKYENEPIRNFVCTASVKNAQRPGYFVNTSPKQSQNTGLVFLLLFHK